MVKKYSKSRNNKSKRKYSKKRVSYKSKRSKKNSKKKQKGGAQWRPTTAEAAAKIQRKALASFGPEGEPATIQVNDQDDIITAINGIFAMIDKVDGHYARQFLIADKAFKKRDKRFDGHDKRLDDHVERLEDHEKRINNLEGIYLELKEMMDKFTASQTSIDMKMKKVEESQRNDIKRVETDMKEDMGNLFEGIHDTLEEMREELERLTDEKSANKSPPGNEAAPAPSRAPPPDTPARKPLTSTESLVESIGSISIPVLDNPQQVPAHQQISVEAKKVADSDISMRLAAPLDERRKRTDLHPSQQPVEVFRALP